MVEQQAFNLSGLGSSPKVFPFVENGGGSLMV